jgi:hypothetical protein
LALIVERYWVEISAVAWRLMRADLLAEADVDAIIHTTTAISPTNAAAAIASVYRIKIKCFSETMNAQGSAASLDQHLSSPKTRRCLSSFAMSSSLFRDASEEAEMRKHLIRERPLSHADTTRMEFIMLAAG